MDSHIDFQNQETKAPEESDFFEFFNEYLNSKIHMSHAEDIMFCGKLIVPYKNQILKTLSSDDRDGINLPRRYSDLLPESNPSCTSSSTRLTQSSRSLNCKELRRNSSQLVMKSELSDFHRTLSKKKPVKSEGFKVSKPKWKVLMFGLVKFPPKIDLLDMKNRQVRCNPGSMFPKMDTRGKIQARRSDWRSSWGHDLLSMLSCKSHASLAVGKL